MKLAMIFNMSIKQLQKLNDLPDSGFSLIAGMRLKILDRADHSKYPNLKENLEKFGELAKLQEAK